MFELKKENGRITTLKDIYKEREKKSKNWSVLWSG